MIISSAFVLLDVQSTLFLDNPGVDIANNALRYLLQEYSDLLDGQPLVLPLPVDAPPELARLTLQSADSLCKVNVSLNRIDFFRYSPSVEVGVDTERIYDIAIDLLTGYADTFELSIRRIANIQHYFLRDDQAASSVPAHFCSERWTQTIFSDLEQFQLHTYKVYQFEQFTVNNWIRALAQPISVVRGGVKTAPAMGLFVESDINTVATPEIVFTNPEVRTFFSTVDAQHHRVLDSYFPEEG